VEIRRALEQDGDTRITDLHIWHDQFRGVVDLVKMQAAFYDEDTQGTEFRWEDIPADLMPICKARREALIEACADPHCEWAYLCEDDIGLFDLPAFIRLVHAGEDVLVAARAGRLVLTPEVVDPLLETLDVVRSWLDALADTEALPVDAHDVSRELAERLRTHIPDAAKSVAGVHTRAVKTSEPSAETWEWIDRLPESARRTAVTAALTVGRPVLAIRYRPDSQCFFSGEDPLFLLRQIPDTAALGVDTERAWPPRAWPGRWRRSWPEWRRFPGRRGPAGP